MSKSRILNHLSLIIAAVCFGTIPVFTFYLSLMGVPSLQQSLFRAIFTVLYLLIAMGVAYSYRTVMIKREHLSHFIIYGLIGIALSIIVYITAIAIGTPVIVAVSIPRMIISAMLVRRYNPGSHRSPAASCRSPQYRSHSIFPL